MSRNNENKKNEDPCMKLFYSKWSQFIQNHCPNNVDLLHELESFGSNDMKIDSNPTIANGLESFDTNDMKIDFYPTSAIIPGWRVGQIKEVGNYGMRKIIFGDIIDGKKCIKAEWIDIIMNPSRIAKYESKQELYWNKHRNDNNNKNKKDFTALTNEANHPQRTKYNNNKRFYHQKIELKKALKEKQEHQKKNQFVEKIQILQDENQKLKNKNQKLNKEYEQRGVAIKNLKNIVADFDKRTKCMICWEEERDTLIIGCFHCDICHKCALKMERWRIKKCPRCQRQYVETQRVNHPLK